MQGFVVSAKLMNKTVMVAVKKYAWIQKYKDSVWLTKKIMCHDEENKCDVGDQVKIVHSRPYSRHKRWRVDEILKKHPPTEFLEKHPEFKVVKAQEKIKTKNYPIKTGGDKSEN
jgi:small subunit ribosomal protein S17